jgi:hypothetical protein
VSAADVTSVESSLVKQLQAYGIDTKKVHYVAEKSLLAILTNKGKEGNMTKATEHQANCLVVRIEKV